MKPKQLLFDSFIIVDMKKNDKKFGGGCASNVGIKRADPRHHQHDWYNMDVFTYNISLQGRFLPQNPYFDRSFYTLFNHDLLVLNVSNNHRRTIDKL